MGTVLFDALELQTAPTEVMTPRTTSERLVAEACARVHGRPTRVADVGTGSGAIAIAIAAKCPDAVVWATDVDARAVALARSNVRRHDLEDRVFVIRGDLLSGVPAPLELIVANLPYLAASAAAEHPELRGEPFSAVFASGDGLDAYRRLVSAAAATLTPTGTLLVQFHRRVLIARHAQLSELRRILENDHEARGAA